MQFLVIGSTHLDTYAKYDPKVANDLEKEGDLQYTVGGGAFNIAANLAAPDERQYGVSLITYINPDSISTGMIRDEIKKRKINEDRVYNFEFVENPESGYVAQAIGYEVKTAVWYNAMGKIGPTPKDAARLVDAVRKHDAIITDTSINAEYRREVINLTNNRKDLFLTFENVVKLIECAENSKLGGRYCKIAFIYERPGADGASWPLYHPDLSQSVRRICDYLVVIDATGYSIYDYVSQPAPPRRLDYPAHMPGDGRWVQDAVVAAISSYYSFFREGKPPDWSRCDEAYVKDFIQRIPIDRNQAYPKVPAIDVEAVRLRETIRKKRLYASITLGVFLFLAIVGTIRGVYTSGSYRLWDVILFFFIPAFAGAAGGVARILWSLVSSESREQLVVESQRAIPSSATLGFMAGLMASLISFIPMLSNTPQMLSNSPQAVSKTTQTLSNIPKSPIGSSKAQMISTKAQGDSGKVQTTSTKEQSNIGKAQTPSEKGPSISPITFIYEIFIGLATGFTLDALFRKISTMDMPAMPR